MRRLALLLAFAASPAFAVVTVTTVGGTKTINFPSNTIGGMGTSFEYPVGTTVATPTPTNGSGWSTAGNFGVARAPTGITVGGEMSTPLPNGRSLPTSVRAPISRAEAAAAVGKFARGVGGAALKTAGAVYAVGSIAKALNDLCNDLGYSCYNNGNGPEVDKVTTPVTGGYKIGVFPAKPTYQAICEDYKNWLVSTSYPDYAATTTPAVTLCKVGLTHPTKAGIALQQVVTFVNGVEGSTTKASITDLENKIASESGWPTTDSIARTVADAINSGQSVSVGQPTVSGPASVAGPTTTSTTPAQNGQPAKTTTTQTTYNNTYNNNTINTTTSVSTTINNGTSTTTTTDQKEVEEAAPMDSPLPEVPKLYTPKYPDGIKGVWDTQIGKVKGSKIGQLTSSLVPTFPETGTCPVWMVSSDFGSLGTFGSGDVAPPCWIWPIAKIFTIIGALFLARALIFGG
jgi:hypothetical protein